jgi:3-hydroxymyristoyl/3-hydroxydecanoyl-(acyl carrier protein) dehydratase
MTCMSDISLDHRGLMDYLPHRGVNIMPDTVHMNAERTKAVSLTTVATSDPRGREIFSRESSLGGARCWYEPFLGELMALTGVPLLHERLKPAGQVAVFSMISRISFFREAPLHEPITGHATITRDRGTFTVFSTTAEVAGQKILEAEVMSGVAALTDISGGRKPSTGDPGGSAIDPSWFAWKPRPCRFVDTIVSEDRLNGRLVAGYRYSSDHPFVPGHFPGAPLMMGVTQWSAIADAAYVAAKRFELNGSIIAQGVIKRVDGAEILDVRDLALSVEAGKAPQITATKRIAFREPVIPGDGITVEVTVKSA